MPGKDDNEGGNHDEDQTGVSTEEQTEHQAIIQAKEQVFIQVKESNPEKVHKEETTSKMAEDEEHIIHQLVPP